MATASRKDRLAALKRKLEQTDVGGSKQGWFNPPIGKSTIRIMPEVGDPDDGGMKFFFQEVGKHYIAKKAVYCPSFTSCGELPCPICEMVDDLYKSGDRKLAGDLRVSKRYWMNVIDRSNEDAGPQIFTPGVSIFAAIIGYIDDPEYGDIVDEGNGTDIIIIREGTGLETKYQVRAARRNSPLHKDDDVVDGWFDKAAMLTWVEASMDPEEDQEILNDNVLYVLPYDRIVMEFELDAVTDGIYEAEDDAEDGGSEHPMKREVSKRRARRARR